jgi:hypothetical protein
MISERRQIADRFLSEGNGEAARILGNRVRDLNKIQFLVLTTNSDLFKFLRGIE